MNTPPDEDRRTDAQAPQIVISGLDEQAGTGATSGQDGNVSPTDEAVQLLQEHKERGEPEDEDG